MEGIPLASPLALMPVPKWVPPPRPFVASPVIQVEDGANEPLGSASSPDVPPNKRRRVGRVAVYSDTRIGLFSAWENLQSSRSVT